MLMEWAVSDDMDGTSWQTREMSSPTDFGNPGPSPYWASGIGGGESRPFFGWAGDPSLAIDTNPLTNNYFSRVYLVNLAQVTYPDETEHTDEIIVALSEDQGSNWRSTHYLTTGDDNGATGTPVSGGGVDLPKIASNFAAPYHSFGVWNVPGKTWLRRFSFDGSGQFEGDDPIEVPQVEGSAAAPDLSFVKLPTGCSGGGEGVAVVYASAALGRCYHALGDPIPDPRPTNFIQWYLAIYDVNAAAWLGPFLISEDPELPLCVGKSGVSTNNASAHVAGDPNGPHLWISHTKGTRYGTRAVVEYGHIECSDGVAEPSFTQIVSPEPCVVDPPTGHCLPNELSTGPVVQDEWLPGIAFADDGSTKRTVMYWYGTRSDQDNSLTKVYAMYEENFGGWSAVQTLYVAPPGNTGGWREHRSKTWDYNLLGADYYRSRFLPAWAGDARYPGTPAAARIQTVLLF